DGKTRVLFSNVGKLGWTSQELLHGIKNDTGLIKAIQTADSRTKIAPCICRLFTSREYTLIYGWHPSKQ
ncbi:hypothetical protein, partial [Aneurinibacillus tyrosinisolvens]|uniref:hypothetical protein n=1 Tax=Aneurinibacillus tyrosinisolvens TaxID=1443435 RepID=UPI000AA7FFC8